MNNIQKYGGYGVSKQLHHTHDTEEVKWVRSNSFVIVFRAYRKLSDDESNTFKTAEGAIVDLVSINGIGEIRWQAEVSDIVSALEFQERGDLQSGWDCAMHLDAARKFGLMLNGKKL